MLRVNGITGTLDRPRRGETRCLIRSIARVFIERSRSKYAGHALLTTRYSVRPRRRCRVSLPDERASVFRFVWAIYSSLYGDIASFLWVSINDAEWVRCRRRPLSEMRKRGEASAGGRKFTRAPVVTLGGRSPDLPGRGNRVFDPLLRLRPGARLSFFGVLPRFLMALRLHLERCSYMQKSVVAALSVFRASFRTERIKRSFSLCLFQAVALFFECCVV